MLRPILSRRVRPSRTPWRCASALRRRKLVQTSCYVTASLLMSVAASFNERRYISSKLSGVAVHCDRVSNAVILPGSFPAIGE